MKASKKSFFLLIAVCIIGVASWYRFYPASEVEYLYRTQPVTRGSITATISATGKVSAVEMIDVGTQVSGTIKELYVDYNSRVKRGQLIALLDPEVLHAKLEGDAASLTVAQAALSGSKASLADAERAYQRNKELWERKLIAKSEMDTAETKLKLAEATLAEASAKVRQARASLKQSTTNLNYTRIVSPVDGVIISKKVNVGQTVAASLSAPTLFTIARDLTQMQIEANIDEADIGRVRKGQRAECKFDSWPKLTFDGTVVQVRLDPVTVSNVVTYTVILKVDNSGLKLLPGMTANISVITEQRDNVLKIPAAALRFTPPADILAKFEPTKGAKSAQNTSPLGSMPFPQRSGSKGSKSRETPTVWLVADGKLKERLPVGEMGVSDRTWVEVIGDKLKEGDELALSYSRAGETSNSGTGVK